MPRFLQRETETASSIQNMTDEKVNSKQESKLDEDFEFMKEVMGV